MQLTYLSKQDWIRILTDPDPPEMARMLRVGQFVTWPKVRDTLVAVDLTAHWFLVTHDRESYALGTSNLLRSSDDEESTARSFRTYLQRTIAANLVGPPE